MRGGWFAGSLLALLLLVMAPESLTARTDLEVLKVVLSDPTVELGEEQLVQISLRNTTQKAIDAGLLIEVRVGKERPTGIRKQRKVSIPPLSERRVFFPLKAPELEGDYNIRLVVLTANFQSHLLTGRPEFFQAFKVIPKLIKAPQIVSDKDSNKGKQTTFNPPEGLKFERPDLTWEKFTVAPKGLLIGETLKIRGDLRNTGGDIAKNIEVRLEYINIRLPNRIQPISTTRVPILAPGEKVELEFEYIFPDDALLGEYKVNLIADNTHVVDESNEDNNRMTTETPIRISTIRQIFPEPNFEFDETGLFLFRWDSRKYNEFKVQVGTEASFESEENYFDIPQGDKWTEEKEVVPLAGELPGMLKGLLHKTGAGTAYWRVVGRTRGTDKQGFSLSLPFTMKLNEPIKQPPQPVRPGSPPQPSPPEAQPQQPSPQEASGSAENPQGGPSSAPPQ